MRNGGRFVIHFSGVGLWRNSFTIGVRDGEKTSSAIPWCDIAGKQPRMNANGRELSDHDMLGTRKVVRDRFDKRGSTLAAQQFYHLEQVH